MSGCAATAKCEAANADTRKHRIFAVVVTFNRKALVPQTLDALRAQTRPLERIMLIDNASTDGTPEVLRARGDLDDPLVDYIRMDTNTGGAGGFHEGMKRAMEAGADWIWVMDDDVAAAPDCLEQLLKWRHISECLHPRRLFQDGSDIKWEGWVDLLTGRAAPLPAPSFRNGKSIYFTNMGCFEGLLVTRRIVEIIGLPPRHYYIAGDDTLFGLKASLHTNVAVVADARIEKLISAKRQRPSWKDYYLVRNHFFLTVDAYEHVGLQLGTSRIAYFLVVTIIRTLGVVIARRAGVVASLRGFRDGMRYMLSNRVRRLARR